MVRESEKGDVEEEWQLFKSVMVGSTEVFAMRREGGGVKNGS